MRPPGPRPSDHIYRNLHRLGWSMGEYATNLGWTVTLKRDGREISATAPTQTQAWQLAERAAVGAGGSGYVD